jgi:hypothetical protein
VYALVAPLFDIQPDSNWVMRHRGKQPYDLVSDGVKERLEALEGRIEEMQEGVCGAAVALALATVRAK